MAAELKFMNVVQVLDQEGKRRRRRRGERCD
jgi:hypothetical protein